MKTFALAHHQTTWNTSERRLRRWVDPEDRVVAGGLAGGVVPDGVRDGVGSTAGDLGRCLVGGALLDLTVDLEGLGGREGAEPGGERQRAGVVDGDGGAHLGGVRHVDVVDLRHVDDHRRVVRRRDVLADCLRRCRRRGLTARLRLGVGMDVHQGLPLQLDAQTVVRDTLDECLDLHEHGALDGGPGVGVEARNPLGGRLGVAGRGVGPGLRLGGHLVVDLGECRCGELELLDDLDLAVHLDARGRGVGSLDLDLVVADGVVVPAVLALAELLARGVGLPVPHFLTGRVDVARPELHRLLGPEAVGLLRLRHALDLDEGEDLDLGVDVHAVDGHVGHLRRGLGRCRALVADHVVAVTATGVEIDADTGVGAVVLFGGVGRGDECAAEKTTHQCREGDHGGDLADDVHVQIPP